jgi:hypothetical protein
LQALELQAVFLGSRPHKTSARTFFGSRSPPSLKRYKKINMLELWIAWQLRE